MKEKEPIINIGEWVHLTEGIDYSFIKPIGESDEEYDKGDMVSFTSEKYPSAQTPEIPY